MSSHRPLTTAETASRFIKELGEVGITDSDTITDLTVIAISEHCHANGGPVVDGNREWR